MTTAPEPTKRPYSQPQLTEYGNIRQMTAANNPKGNKDGGPNNTRSGG